MAGDSSPPKPPEDGEVEQRRATAGVDRGQEWDFFFERQEWDWDGMGRLSNYTTLVSVKMLWAVFR